MVNEVTTEAERFHLPVTHNNTLDGLHFDAEFSTNPEDRRTRMKSGQSRKRGEGGPPNLQTKVSNTTASNMTGVFFVRQSTENITTIPINNSFSAQTN